MIEDDDIDETEKQQRRQKELERIRREAKEEARRLQGSTDELEREIIHDGQKIEEAREEVEKMRKALRRSAAVDEQRLENETNNAFRLVLRRIYEVKEGRVKPKSGEIGESFIAKLIEEGIDGRLNQYNAPYIYPIIERLILSETITLQELKEFFKKINRNVFLDKDLIRGLAEVYKETARKIDPTLNEFHLGEIFKVSEHRFTNTDGVLYEMLEEMGEEYTEFFEAILSSKNFVEYAIKKQEEIGKQIEKEDESFSSLSPEEKRKKIAERFSQYLRNKVATIIFKIYAVADMHQNEPFDHIEKHGIFMFTPSDFYLSFTHKIEELRGSFSTIKDIFVSIPKFEERVVINPDTGRESRAKILKEKNNYLNLKDGYSASAFFDNLYQYATSQKERLSFGHNIRYLIKVASTNDKIQEEGFFKMLKNFSANLNSSYLDEIFLEGDLGNIVMAAINIFERNLELTFAQKHWQGDPKLLELIFASLSRYEREMLDEFIKRYGARYSQEEIRRAIYNAQIIFLGVNYQLLHYFSFIEPETPITASGYGEIMMSFYNQGTTIQRRFGGNNLTAGGADYMPINYYISNFDHRDGKKKWKIAYDESFERGRAVFYPLTLDDNWKTVRLAINPGNICEAGGFSYLARWRMFNAYKYYLIETGVLSYDKESLDFDKHGVKTYTLAWKHLENLGINTLKNFAIDKFILDEIVKDGEPNETKIEAFVNLFEYLYDRYYSQTIAGVTLGNIFLPKEVRDKESFVAYLKKRLSSRYPPSVIKGFAKELIYDVFTMMLIERSPSKLLTLEKPMFTQNGEILMDEVRQRLTTGEGTKMSYEEFQIALKDLQYVETELRARTIKEMERLKERLGNVYGDLEQSKSQIDFVLDEAKIRRFLTEYYQLKGLPKEEREKRIGATISVFKTTIGGAKEIPQIAKWERKLAGEGDKSGEIKEKKEQLAKKKRKILRTNKERLEIENLEWEIFRLEKMLEARERFVSRFQWFSKMWREDEWGMSITSGDLAYPFLRFSANGQELMYRVAGFNYDVAEVPAKVWAGGFTEALRQARVNHSLEPVYKIIDDVSKAALGQWGAGYQASKCVMPFLKRMVYYFRRDERRGAILNLRRLRDMFKTIPAKELEDLSYSFSQEDAGGWRAGNIYDFGPDDLTEITRVIIGGRGKKYVDYSPSEIPFKLTTIGEKHKFIGRLAEKLPFLKKLANRETFVRDLGKEVSATAVKYNGGFTWDKFWRLEIEPRLILILLFITLILLGKSAKEDLKIGGGKQ